jgi:NADH-quinone oxidoreductase subunit E
LDEVRQDLTPILTAFPRQGQFLLPALERIQEELGHLPLWTLDAVGQHLRVPRSEVYGVATHYPEFRLEAPARHVVKVCTGLSCQVLGASSMLGALERALAVRTGQVSPDGQVSLEETACAFICGVAPVIEVDGQAHGGLHPEQAAAVVRELASR